MIDGFVEDVSDEEIRGWVYESTRPNIPLDVEVRAGSERIAIVRADLFREDLLAAGKGNGRHAFLFRRQDGMPLGFLTARVAGERYPLALAPTALTAPPRTLALFQHSLFYGLPTVDYGFDEASEVDPAEMQLCERLVAAFRHADQCRKKNKPALIRRMSGKMATRGGDNDVNDMWSKIKQDEHDAMVRIIVEEGAVGLAGYMRTLYAQGIAHGIVQGPSVTRGLSEKGAVNFWAATIHDQLVSLAEALGCLAIESPEQLGRWAENMFHRPDDLVAMISETLGIDLVPPRVAEGLFGIRLTDGRVLGTRDVLACYAAIRLRDILRDADIVRPAVCEIGAGIGGVAYYAHRLGVFDYTVIDLPELNVVQGYYLGRAVGPDFVRLFGEKGETSAAEPVIRILPTWEFNSRDGERYDLTLNQDSFPEMHPDYALSYLREALENTRYGVLSINQEAAAPQTQARCQSVVADLVREVGRYRRAYRFRHWLRAGYVEELYRPMR